MKPNIKQGVIFIVPNNKMLKNKTKMCVKNVLWTHMDKLENDLKLVRNALVSYIQQIYGVLPHDQPVKTLDIVNGHLNTNEVDIGQRNISTGLTPVRVYPVCTSMKIKKPESTTSTKYKCSFCRFQSKNLGIVRSHLKIHTAQKDNEKATAQNLSRQQHNPQQRTLVFRCEVCSESFSSRSNCLDHIQKDHNQPLVSSSNDDTEIEQITANIAESVGTLEPDSRTQQTEPAVDEGIADSNDHNESMVEENPGRDNNVETPHEGRLGNLDIESMLAVIHHENPSTGNEQNVV